MRRPLRVVLALGALLALASPGHAQTPDMERAKASFKAGANAYAAGDYEAAIQALEDAYEISPLPAIAFSLAQAERKQYFLDEKRPHLERAVALFRRYLEQEPRGARREDARLAISQLLPLLGPEHAATAEVKPKSQAHPTRLMIVSDTPGARITLDDGAAAPSPLIREVTPGRHRARVRAEGYVDAERDVTALAGELLLREVRLTEKPGTLFVWAPADAEVYVDGVLLGHGGELITAQLAAGRHQLSVAQPGRHLVERDVQLQRGKAHTEIVRLEPTTQRTVSSVLFITGGATLGLSVILGALAVRSENDVEELWRTLQHQNVSSAELVAYNASLVERNRFRTAATVGFAGALGMFVTGLFLHELDRPRSPALRRREDLPRLPEPSAALPRFSWVSSAPAADLGASLRVSF